MKEVLVVAASFFKNESLLYDSSYYKVAIDRGYLHFYQNKIDCDLLIGDFDTLDIDDYSFAKKVIKLNPKKDDTDTFYAIKYLLELGYDDFTFLGCLGSRNDMTFSSYSFLMYLLKRKVSALLSSDDEEVFLLSSSFNNEYIFNDINRKVSFLSISEESRVSLKGFEYDYEGKFYFDYPLGISNTVKIKGAKIDVLEGVIICFLNLK